MKHSRDECIYRMLKTLGPANIIEKSDINLEKEILIDILKSLKIEFEWRYDYNNNTPDVIFIRGYNNSNYLQVRCTKEKLLRNLNKANNMRAFL